MNCTFNGLSKAEVTAVSFCYIYHYFVYVGFFKFQLSLRFLLDQNLVHIAPYLVWELSLSYRTYLKKKDATLINFSTLRCGAYSEGGGGGGLLGLFEIIVKIIGTTKLSILFRV